MKVINLEKMALQAVSKDFNVWIVDVIIRDNRFKEETIIRKAMAIIMYAIGSCSIRFISRFLKVAESTISGYIKAEAENAILPEITEEIKEIEIDEMWHFIQKKLTKSGFS